MPLAAPTPTEPLEYLESLDTGAVWRAATLAQAFGAVHDTGHSQLSAQLPGGGWPVGALIEILQVPGQHLEWQLLVPALAGLQLGKPGIGERALVLVGPPHTPFGPGLAGRGLRPQALLCVEAQSPLERLWATEQALHCADVAAVLAWLPQARSDQLRRLQMAAAQHQRLLFVMRPAHLHAQASPAVLRLQVLQGASDGPPQASTMPVCQRELKLLKRRGPPLTRAVQIPSAPARLTALLACGRLAMGAARRDALVSVPHEFYRVKDHALDRAAVRC
ncbi:MAG: hypothetical protein RL459_180 [Pseudomonadota bacterium]